MNFRQNFEADPDFGQPTAIEKLAAEFKQPTTSSEAVAMNSIWMILKTLQPKRKDAYATQGTFVNNKSQFDAQAMSSKYCTWLYNL